MLERWKDIPGYEGSYQVSDQGRIRSLPRMISYSDGRKKAMCGRILCCGWAGRRRNYAIVQLSKENKPAVRYIHDLVLLAFVGPKPPGTEVCHGHNGQRDNSLQNLSYGTPSQNQRDRRRDGTGNNRQLRRSDGKEYDSIGEAARDIGVNRSSLSSALNGHRERAGGHTWEFIDV